MNLDLERSRLRQQMRERLQALDRSGRWYEIKNAAGDNNQPAEVRIWGTIGGWFGDVDAKTFAEDLDQISASQIVVSINSLGGDVFDGIAIYNTLRQHKAHITTRVDSMAASIASVIAQAGDERVMVTASQMMIHRAWGLAIGNATDMRGLADILEMQDDIISGVYASRSGKAKAEWLEAMQSESWFDADKAVEAGLADTVMDPPKKDKPDGTSTTDNSSHRFAAQLDAVVTAVEQAATETGNVITFRQNQGKPPLSDDAVASLSRLAAAAQRLADQATGDGEPAPEDEPAESFDDELARFLDLSLRIDQMETT